MLSVLTLLLLVVPLATDGKAAPARGEAAAILRVVIQREAAGYGQIPDDVRPCLNPVLMRPTFDPLRRAIAHPPKIVLPRGGTLTAADFGRPSPDLPWDRLDPADPAKLRPVEGVEKDDLTRAVRHIVDRGKLPPVARAADQSLLSPPFRLCPGKSELPSLELSSPDIDGDFAFVQAEFQCVLCGHGTTYALRRGQDGWQIFAEWTSWMS